jgi:hypothetical protein
MMTSHATATDMAAIVSAGVEAAEASSAGVTEDFTELLSQKS